MNPPRPKHKGLNETGPQVGVQEPGLGSSHIQKRTQRLVWFPLTQFSPSLHGLKETEAQPNSSFHQIIWASMVSRVHRFAESLNQ